MSAKEIDDYKKCDDNKYVGDAVGVPKRNWFIAIVNNNTERSCGELLKKLGYDCFIPIQKETQLSSNGTKKTINRVVMSAALFIHLTEAERKTVVNYPFIKRFMVNIAGNKDQNNRRQLAIVSDYQIERFRFMLNNADSPVKIESMPLQIGDKVRVINGKLKGLEGNIVGCKDGGSYIIVRINGLGCAIMKISPADVEVCD